MSVTVSAVRKEVSSKVDGFHQRENRENGIRHSLKNTFPLCGKTASSGKKIKNGFH